jgi:hypothetical protein
MRVLIDYHHACLAESMHRLFEDRLGLEVWLPKGMEWFDEGYWVHGAGHMGDILARQYLLMPDTDSATPERKHRMCTLEEFRAMGEWAVICPTVQENQHGFARLAQEVGAAYAYGVGNTGQRIDWSLDPFVLSSSEAPLLGRGMIVHQEFDMEGAFAYSPFAGNRRSVASFLINFHRLPGYPLFEEAKALLPKWDFRCYGHGPDGWTEPTSRLGELMRRTAFAWHDKPTGDGFGHSIHGWAAVGRPLIGHASYYRGQLAEDLWEDGVTCIDLDKHSPAETARLMEEIASTPEMHAGMCQEIAKRVRSRIDFAAEAQRVAEGLGLLVPA